jgi:hypothetical protein
MMEVKTMKETKKPGKKTSEHLESVGKVVSGAAMVIGVMIGIAKMFEKK